MTIKMTPSEIAQALRTAAAYAANGHLYVASRWVEVARRGLAEATGERPASPVRLRVVKEGE
jgi:hypothetical protein